MIFSSSLKNSNFIYGTGVATAGTSAFTEDDIRQIRSRLQIDGDKQNPSTQPDVNILNIQAVSQGEAGGYFA